MRHRRICCRYYILLRNFQNIKILRRLSTQVWEYKCGVFAFSGHSLGIPNSKSSALENCSFGCEVSALKKVKEKCGGIGVDEKR